ncbi:hypothetical protein WA158_003085 [Blastocystis sp. Blastoise]
MSDISNDPFIVAVPNDDGEATTLQELKNTFPAKENYCGTYEFKIPHLITGSLEQLINLSDQMQKMDQNCKNIIEKISRTYTDFVSNDNAEKLDVNGMTIEQYIQTFSWNDARHPHNRSLVDITYRIVGEFKKVDEDLKKMLSQYQDTKNSLGNLQRKRGTNLLTTPLETVLSHEQVERATGGMKERDVFINTPFLQTVCVVITTPQEREFLDTYQDICQDKVVIRGDEGRSTAISPVLPNSAKFLVKDDEGYLLYSVVILKKFLNDFETACKEKRFTVRYYDLNSITNTNDSESEQDKLQKLSEEEKSKRVYIVRWCRPNFSDCYSSWVHLKYSRECNGYFYIPMFILYYFITFSIFPLTKNTKKIYDCLYTKYSYLGGHSGAYGDLTDSDAVTAASLGSTDVTLYPYASIHIEGLNKTTN